MRMRSNNNLGKVLIVAVLDKFFIVLMCGGVSFFSFAAKCHAHTDDLGFF